MKKNTLAKRKNKNEKMPEVQGTVPQAVDCRTPGPAIHMKHSVNDNCGAEGWSGLGDNIEIII